MSPTFAIGIDLGTTNSALAFLPIAPTQPPPPVQLLPIPQFLSAGTIESRPLLPSFLYIPTDDELRSGTYRLPNATDADTEVVAGYWARQQSARVPTRTVAAAKSWLAHSRVDRHQPILPWNAPDPVRKISPVDASRRYLAQIAYAWNQRFPDAPLAHQRVVLTVPASFDERARELTHEAALAAGLPQNLILLEEPQAAVYAWLAAAGDRWRQSLRPNDCLLVCDVGGGTTDFTLVTAKDEAGDLILDRKAVGNHILVGGDNMDLALAHYARTQFAAQGVDVDAWQAVSLWHACRDAKETLLGPTPPTHIPVAIPGRSSRLIGGTIATNLDPDAVKTLLLDGFFAPCALSDRPNRQRASGFRELGLPYENEPSVTKHLAHFLTRHGDPAGPARPTHLLFNGGVFKADPIRARVREVIASWFPGTQPARVLEASDDYDFAVAKGAAYYALIKQGGKAIRIRGGVPRSYYVGIETAGPAVPGLERPLQARCIVPFGMEEGSEIDVPGDEIGLVIGEPAQFRVFTSTARPHDTPGHTLEVNPTADLDETDSLETTLPPVDGLTDDVVPVRFHSHVTELGLLELWCASTQTPNRWKLEFQVRTPPNP